MVVGVLAHLLHAVLCAVRADHLLHRRLVHRTGGVGRRSQADLFVTIGSAAVIVLMLVVAAVLGFNQSALLDDAEIARLARAEGANVEAAAIDANGRAAVAKLNGGKLLIAKVMADGVSTRVLSQGQARV